MTEWYDEGEPTKPFGPDGIQWSSPDELIRAMTAALATTSDIQTTGGLVERNISGTFVGSVRMRLDPPDGNLIAGDLRIDMRNDGGGSWYVVDVRTRNNCAIELVDGECP
ncbi:MAG: hypothetical protein ABIW50_06975 [Candidatus Limnocylindria bacterium]